MMIKNLTNRALSDDEQATIAQIRRYTDDSSNFALIANRVAVFITDAQAADNDDAINAVKNIAQETLSTHPDFELYLMDDGYGISLMCNGDLIILSEKKISPEELNNDGSIKLPIGLALRQAGLSSCESIEVIALVICEGDSK